MVNDYNTSKKWEDGNEWRKKKWKMKKKTGFSKLQLILRRMFNKISWSIVIFSYFHFFKSSVRSPKIIIKPKPDYCESFTQFGVWFSLAMYVVE